MVLAQHNGLAYELEYYGIQNDILQLISAWLFEGTQKVIIDGVSSYPAPVLSGVHQGYSSMLTSLVRAKDYFSPAKPLVRLLCFGVSLVNHILILKTLRDKKTNRNSRMTKIS